MPAATKPLDTRSALLSEAERLIRTRGYSGFSYADLSSAVGISKASIHHHFPTKETLAASVLADYQERYASGFLEIEADSAGALERIEAYGQMYFAGVRQGLGCLCAALAAERDTLPANLLAGTAAFFDTHLHWLRQIYAAGLARAELNDRLSAEEAAHLILATLEGALMIQRILGSDVGLGIAVATLRKTLMPDSTSSSM